ncbi:superoxide dismutase [Novosphingobium flavum]|uniref:Superoxide dismutase n=1 Tax=Novosphingobium flavum TaxID=1778672 RepID=A0A7X1FP08_9SPHN|nr:superoxide dismutase [Novosphingobium flavum]MBC2664330.1 superoxide dismutase [Novosphingobium flavum]
MPISLMPLPYGADALSPAISSATLDVHHGKHHKAYVDKTNAATAGTALENAALEDIVAAARKDNPKLFNNAAQTWNHGFYWASLSPDKTAPAGELLAAIERDFGSVEALTKELASSGADHFASGWVWLAEEGGKLVVVDTHDAETLADTGAKPLLVIDLWEHAYYVDRKNLRPDYLKAVLDELINWDFAAANLASEGRWVYPA